MQTVEWENFYTVCSWIELNELITIVVEYLIVSKLGNILLLCKVIIKCMSFCTSDLLLLLLMNTPVQVQRRHTQSNNN